MRILSPCLISLFHYFRDGASADGVAAFANRKPQALLQRHRSDQAHFAAHVVSRHHHLHPLRQLHVPRHVRRPKVKLRPVSREKRRVPPPFFLRQHVRFRLELRVWGNASRLAHHLSPLHVFLFRPAQQNPTLSPASPSSNSFRNISTPVTTFFCVARKPTISTSSPTFTLPRSTRPVTTVPRPEIENISSIGMANGLSTSRTGNGTFLSTASINSSMVFSHLASPFKACSAEPLITGILSPGNW